MSNRHWQGYFKSFSSFGLCLIEGSDSQRDQTWMQKSRSSEASQPLKPFENKELGRIFVI